MKDHGGRRYIFNYHKLNSIQFMWLDLIRIIDSKINHINAKENEVLDAISRSPQWAYSGALSTCIIDIMERIKRTLYRDQKNQHVKNFGRRNQKDM